MDRVARLPLLILGLAISVALIASNPALAQDHKSTSPHWSYSGAEGPQHWGDLDPSFATCKTGMHQSPINIVNPNAAKLEPIQFDYKPSPLKIINNGHTFQINYAPGSTVTIAGKQYPVVQFHFHKPSEEAISGKHYDMVMHIVHMDGKGAAAVVGVLLKGGNDNAFIQKLWNNLPMEVGKESDVPNVTINLAEILPVNQNYYHFSGSLTTPPCSEGVEFYILKTPAEISAGQVAAYAKFYPMNARPIQPLNGREIQEADFKK